MFENLLPEIETARLKMRVYKPEDIADIKALWSEPAIARYFPVEYAERTPAEMLESVRRMLARWRERGYGQWGITVKPNDKIIGYCGFQPLNQTKEVELFYGFSGEYWGRGYATEAALAALRFAFETLQLPRVIAVTYQDNHASQHVLTKVKMVSKGIQHVYDTDVNYFEMKREDFVSDNAFYQTRFVEAGT